MQKKSPEIQSPKRAQQFLYFFLKEELAEEVAGDLEEQFHAVLERSSPAQARRNYWYQVFHYLRPFAIRNITSPNLNHLDMFRNYFKIGYRQLWRNKSSALINIGGLAVGITVVMLIGLWIHDELTFNQTHQNYAQLGQLMQHQTFDGDIYTQDAMPYPVTATLREEYGSSFKYLALSTWPSDHILTKADKIIHQKGIYIEPDGPHLLDLKMKAGTRADLKNPGSIIISETTAENFFKSSNPIGQALTIDNELKVTVTGVYEDFPVNSSFYELQFLADWELYTNTYDWEIAARENPNWDDNSYQAFAQIADHTTFTSVNKQIKSVKQDGLPEGLKRLKAEVFINPMQDWHLRSNWESGAKAGGPIQYVWLFGIIGVFVLILACINFMNLSTAQSEKRAKEVGIRKSLGSFRSQLISQFLSESFLVVVLSFLVGIMLLILFLPSFNQLADKQISFPYREPMFWLLALSFIVFTSFLAGSYPALYLSSFQPIKVLKGKAQDGHAAAGFRKGLVIVQFTVSIILIIGTLVVEKQIQYTGNRPLGYDESGLIMMEITTTDYNGKYNLIRKSLIERGAIVDMAVSSSPLTAVWNSNGGFRWEGKAADFNPIFSVIRVSHDFGATVGWEVLEGRDYSREYQTDSTAYLLNEAAVKYMGLEDPVGKIITWYQGQAHPVIGVVKDMVMKSPFQSVDPAIYMMDYTEHTNFIDLKLNPELSTKESLAIVKATFKEYVPSVPFSYKFADQEHALKFAAEDRVQKLSRVFALLAIFISCLGLFGLAAFMASQRKKEIGIRKVLGASVFNLWRLLSQEFLILVGVSCLLAVPVAYWALNNWLDNYTYRTGIPWWFLAIACLAAVGLTLITVSFQSIRAANRSPVQSIRSGE
ncbi:MAG: ABC transporter permease [Saprospiraceae bacterium]